MSKISPTLPVAAVYSLSAVIMLAFPETSTTRAILIVTVAVLGLTCLSWVKIVSIRKPALILSLIVGAMVFISLSKSVISLQTFHAFVTLNLLLALVICIAVMQGKVYARPMIYAYAGFIVYTTSLALNARTDIEQGFTYRNLLTAISVPYLFLVVLLGQSETVKGKYLIFAVSVAALIMAVAAVGRSGIIAHSLLVLSAAILILKKQSPSLLHIVKSIPIQHLLGLMCILFLSIFVGWLNGFAVLVERLNYFSIKGFESSERIEILNAYLFNFRSINVMLGDVDGSLLPDSYNNNLHNTFLYLQSSYGIAGAVLIVFIVASVVIQVARLSWMLPATAAVIVRVWTDSANDVMSLTALLALAYTTCYWVASGKYYFPSTGFQQPRR
jgi:hypothetical protein